jgi:hypothetical protein
MGCFKTGKSESILSQNDNIISDHIKRLPLYYQIYFYDYFSLIL